MNKKGQTLVTFVLVIPILIIILGGVIELSVVSYNKNKITQVTKTAINKFIDYPDDEKIKHYFKKNNIDGNIEINSSDGLEIIVNTKIESVLGNLYNKKEYIIKIDLIGHKENDKIKIKKGS